MIYQQNVQQERIISQKPLKILLVIIIVLTNKIDCKKKLKGDKGTLDVNNEYPFVVVLEKQPINYGDFEIRKKCSGTLIDDNWIITSAHCLDDDIKTVRYGNMTTDMNRIDILLKIQHPLYRNLGSKYLFHSGNDIGLVKVDKIPVQFGKLNPIAFTNLTNEEVIYADHGRPYLGKKERILEVLKSTENAPLKLFKGIITDCKKEVASLLYDSICVKTKRTPVEITRESSGGPLFFDNKIIGVNVGLLYNSSVVRFVPISPYLEWIHEVITNVNNNN